MCMHLYRKSLFLPDLLFEDVHRCLVCFELLVLEENPPPQLQRRRQVRVVAEVTFKEEARHKTFPEHRLMDKCLNRTDETSINHQQSDQNEMSSERRGGRRGKSKVLSSTQNNIVNKQACGDIRCPEAQGYLDMKDFSLSSHSEVSLQGGNMLGSFAG